MVCQIHEYKPGLCALDEMPLHAAHRQTAPALPAAGAGPGRSPPPGRHLRMHAAPHMKFTHCRHLALKQPPRRPQQLHLKACCSTRSCKSDIPAQPCNVVVHPGCPTFLFFSLQMVACAPVSGRCPRNFIFLRMISVCVIRSSSSRRAHTVGGNAAYDPPW